MALPVLSGIFLVIANFLRPHVIWIAQLLGRKLWFLVALIAIFLGPLDFLGDTILSGVAWLVPEIETFINLAKNADFSEMRGAIQKIGSGAALANCVIAIDAFVAVGIVVGAFVIASLGARAAIFFYSMIPAKGT